MTPITGCLASKERLGGQAGPEEEGVGGEDIGTKIGWGAGEGVTTEGRGWVTTMGRDAPEVDGREAVTFNCTGTLLLDDEFERGEVVGVGMGVCSQVLLAVREYPFSQPLHARVGVTVKSQHLGGSNLKMIWVRSEKEGVVDDESVVFVD